MGKAIVTLRIAYSDWKKIRQIFPAERNETVIHYIMRLRKFLEEKYNGM